MVLSKSEDPTAVQGGLTHIIHLKYIADEFPDSDAQMDIKCEA